MAQGVMQTSLAAGELSPTLYARVDLSKFASGVAIGRNFFVDYRGGMSNRAGTEFIGLALNSDEPVRLFPFQFNTEQTYMLEFGDQYMRVIMDGGYVLETAQVITAISQADPGVITITAHGYSDDDWVFIEDVGGMVEIDSATNQPYIVDNRTADTFTLTDIYGNAIDTTAFTAYTSGGTAARVYTVVTPYVGDDLALLKFTQSADVMTLCHVDYAPYKLTRTAHAAWTFSQITFEATIDPPASPTATPTLSGGAATTYQYVVTSVSAGGEESVASAVASAANSKNFAEGSAAAPQVINLAWTVEPLAVSYNIYKAPENSGSTPAAGSLYGFIGSADSNSFTDDRIDPDYSICPPTAQDPFASGNNPGNVCYYQQRQSFGGPSDNPDTLYLSKPAAFTNMDTTTPSRDDDALTFTLSSQQVNAILHQVPTSTGLITLTSSGSWLVSGGNSNPPLAITPTNVLASPQSFNGVSDQVAPISVNSDILYVQSKGAKVRNLSYNYLSSVFTGNDLSLLSDHLFAGHTITEWAYAEEPFKIIWAIRDDGWLLSFTYLKEQEVYGWARSDTEGKFLSVCSIPEGDEDAVYFVVERIVGGVTRKYIERLHSRSLYTPYGPAYGNMNSPVIGDVTSAWFLDFGLRYGPDFLDATCTPGATGQPDEGEAFAPVTGVNFEVDSNVFTAGMDENILRINGGVVQITAYVDAQNLTGTIIYPLVDANPAPSGTWTCTTPVEEISGLKYAAGMTFGILAGGSVMDEQEVSEDGTLTLASPADIVTVGLPYVGQIASLYLNVGGTDDTIQGKQKKITAMTARVADTRGLKMGNAVYSRTGQFSQLSWNETTEYKMRTSTVYAGSPIPLETGDQRINMKGGWGVGGQVCVQQTYPLPASVLGIIPEVMVGDIPSA